MRITPSNWPLALSILLFTVALPAGAADKTIIGWIEPARIMANESELVFSAKIDTGADYSSIDIESLKVITRNDVTWIRFELEDDNGKTVTLEKPLHKITRIKRKGAESQPRFVVLLEMCLGQVRHTTRFSLVDRHNYKYRLLVGRDFLRERFIVDPAMKNTTLSICSTNNE